MAFNAANNGNYGTGAGNLIVPAANTVINHYASIIAVDGNQLTVSGFSDSAAFVVGNLVFVHVSVYSGDSATYAHCGKWHVARITNITGDVVTVNKTIRTTPLPAEVKMQIVSCPEYSTVTLNSGTSITCPAYNASLGYGGIVAFKCSKELIFNGGHIDLRGKGLPNANLRTLTKYESNSSMTSQENCDARIRLPLNYPDGVLFTMVKKMTCHADSRIGNISKAGVARTLLQNQGGSSILICAQTVENFQPAMISKEPSTVGKGKGRCYIATDSRLPCDEGLYAYDRISDSTRMSRVFNIKSFGDGSDGSRTDYLSPLNNYAPVTAVDSTKKVFTVGNKTSDGLAKFKVGALVMIHVGAKDYYALQGRFTLAKIIDITLDKITVDTALLEGTGFNPTKYKIQLVTIPQFENFTLTKEYTNTKKFENGRGGIFAIAVNGTCDLSGGVINLVGKGGGVSGGVTMLNQYISTAQMAERLPVGEGNGSAFILANNIIMNTSTRIGGTWDGSGFGGSYGGQAIAGWIYDSTPGNVTVAMHGSGKGGGTCTGTDTGVKYDTSGGYNSNGKCQADGQTRDGGKQGAHILICANQITGLCLHALSTGGGIGAWWSESTPWNTDATEYVRPSPGGCGYGGGGAQWKIPNGGSIKYYSGCGGYIGGGAGVYIANNGTSPLYCGGGGSAGFAYIYCNKAVSQKTANMIPVS